MFDTLQNILQNKNFIKKHYINLVTQKGIKLDYFGVFSESRNNLVLRAVVTHSECNAFSRWTMEADT